MLKIGIFVNANRDKDGTYIVNALGKETAKDTFGHAYLAGSANCLSTLVSERLGIGSRSVELSLPQRCASHITSLTDINEAIMCGRTAVKKAISGLSGQMVIMNRVSSNPYVLSYESKPLNEIANVVHFFPTKWVKDGCDIADEFITYATPLVNGEINYKLVNGLPHFATLKKIKV